MKRLLNILILEPGEKLSPPLGSSVEESIKRHRALGRVLMSQLVGLQNTTIRFHCVPQDAVDAIKFWLTPLFPGNAEPHGDRLLLVPESNAPSIPVEFVVAAPESSPTTLAPLTGDDSFDQIATMDAFAVDCGARWINTAFTQVKQPHDLIVGTSTSATNYLLLAGKSIATELSTPQVSLDRADSTLRERSKIPLPPVQAIHNKKQWDAALTTAIGGKLRAAEKKEP